MNFDFLKREDGYYDLFADAAIEAERIFATSPAMCAVGCRKALELAVKWVYAADSTIVMPYRDNLASLIDEYTFKKCVDPRVWRNLRQINKLGNLSVHTEMKVRRQDALLSLRVLFDFVDWIDYCYGRDYQERKFDERKIPPAGVPLTKEHIQVIKSREALLVQQDERIKVLEAQIKAMSEQLTAEKKQNTSERSFNPEEISEYKTRKIYIDTDLRLAGWDMDNYVLEEREVSGMPSGPDKYEGTGYVDYVLLGKDGKPLAVLEAKKTMYSAKKGEEQAIRYANCLEKEYGRRPLIFLSNGFETFYLNDNYETLRQVSSVFSQAELQTIVNRQNSLIPLSEVRVNDDISGRYYQIEAIRKVCANIEEGHRKSLLVMATGTGKTRVSAGLTDVLMRSNRVKNVLFLADRIALVSQAKHAYQEYLPNVSLCNLCKNKEDKNARIVFSTYPTILNAIDTARNEDNVRIYTPAHFDLIIVDEAHRSIFKKYKAIFDYFDALIVGLTATPAESVDRNTYDFFEVEQRVPTYVYEYQTAVEQDHVLVPYKGIETHTTFLDEGITYDDLSAEDKERIEEDFEEAQQDVPDYIAPSEIDTWVYNRGTIDTVLQTLMEHGIHVDGGQTLGKTIIFAQNQKHAHLIVDRFHALYPSLGNDYIKRVLYNEDYSHTIIDDFKLKPRPVITVSVDMMDTGIDVPEVVNLVFFKKVRSKIKFWQMIGRGTRLCEGLNVVDPLDGSHENKERFFIFDWCRNFQFFKENENVSEGRMAQSLSEVIFGRQAQLVYEFQSSAYTANQWQDWRDELVDTIHYQVVSLIPEKEEDTLVSVRLHRAAVEKFKQKKAYDCIAEADLGVLKGELAPLVHNDETDIDALRFDSLMYGFMCSLCDGQKINTYRKKLVSISLGLQGSTTIPQVKEKLPLLERITEDEFFDNISALDLEMVRKELRGIIRFLEKGGKRKAVLTTLADPVQEITLIDDMYPDEDYADYKLKVNRYIQDQKDKLVIYKLRHNKPMTEVEYDELERIFTEELGDTEDYSRAYGDTPFGLLVRSVVKLDRGAAMEAFAEFINDQSLTEQQIAFVHRIVDYIVANGYMDPSALASAPFDRPQSFVRLFDTKHQISLVSIINKIKHNAEDPAA